MNPCAAISLAISLLCLTGCDKLPVSLGTNVNWLVGTWILDREKTLQALQDNTTDDSSNPGLAGQIANFAIQATAEKAISPLENMKFVFTESNYSEEVGGYGRGYSYEILDRPSRNEIKIKDERGRIRTYTREGNSIWYNLAGRQQLRVYLKPAIRDR